MTEQPQSRHSLSEAHAIQILRKAGRYAKKRPCPYKKGTTRWMVWASRRMYPKASLDALLRSLKHYKVVQ